MTTDRSKQNSIFLALPLISGCLWGCAGFFVRNLGELGYDNLTIISSRTFLAVAVLFVVLLFYDKKLLVINPKDAVVFLAAGAVGIVFLNYGYNDSINELSLAFSAVLLGIFPTIVLVLARIIFKERISKTKAVCSVMAIIGCAMVSGAFTTGGFSVETLSARGILMGLLAALSYAVYSIVTRLAFEKGYSALTMTFYSQLAAAIVLIPFTDWHVIGSSIATVPTVSLPLLIGNSILIAVMPYLLYNIGIGRTDTGKASILAAGSEPSAAMVLGALVYLEIPGVIAIAGLVITIIALSVVCKSDS